jgi:hypothetical protein
LVQIVLGWKELSTVQMKGQILSQKCKNRVWSFENLLLKNHCARRAHIYRKAFWYNVDSMLFKSWSPGVGMGHSRVKHIYICFNGKNLSKSVQETPDPKNFKFT